MRQRTKKTIYATSIILGLFVFVVVFVRATYEPSFLSFASLSAQPTLASTMPLTEVDPTSVKTIRQETAPAPVPVAVPQNSFHISIPSISVDAHVEDVGIKASTGNIDTPKILSDAAWYNGDAIPGQPGTAVILGHVDNGLGLEGVFKDLKSVQVGADVYVTNKDGSVVHFVVTDVTDYALATAPVQDILHDPANPVALKIITCDKNWYGGRYHYDHRVVVTAVPAAS